MVKMKFWDQAKSDLAKFHGQLRQALLLGCREVFDDWTLGKRLRGELFRYRVHKIGAYRILYIVLKSSSVEIVAIGHRKDIYERMTKRG